MSYTVKHLICIMGATAIGKTALSIAVARHFKTEIISADSRQFYREMTIGTAVPSREELQQARHHFIQHLSVSEPYSVGHYERDALELMQALFKDHDVLVAVGGSGLYLRALLEGLDDFPEIDPRIRAGLNSALESEGLASLQYRLKEADPLAFGQIDIENPHRLIRALEVSLGTGRPYSSFLTSSKAKRPFRIIKIGLTADREVIYDRINRRVDSMMENGLYEEARKLYEFRNLNALNTVGYKELFNAMDGDRSLEEAISEIKKNSRRFAKRQLTWYRKESDIHWFNYDTPYEQVISEIEAQIKKPA